MRQIATGEEKLQQPRMVQLLLEMDFALAQLDQKLTACGVRI